MQIKEAHVAGRAAMYYTFSTIASTIEGLLVFSAFQPVFRADRPASGEMTESIEIQCPQMGAAGSEPGHLVTRHINGRTIAVCENKTESHVSRDIYEYDSTDSSVFPPKWPIMPSGGLVQLKEQPESQTITQTLVGVAEQVFPSNVVSVFSTPSILGVIAVGLAVGALAVALRVRQEAGARSRAARALVRQESESESESRDRQGGGKEDEEGKGASSRT